MLCKTYSNKMKGFLLSISLYSNILLNFCHSLYWVCPFSKYVQFKYCIFISKHILFTCLTTETMYFFISRSTVLCCFCREWWMLNFAYCVSLLTRHKFDILQNKTDMSPDWTSYPNKPMYTMFKLKKYPYLK